MDQPERFTTGSLCPVCFPSRSSISIQPAGSHGNATQSRQRCRASLCSRASRAWAQEGSSSLILIPPTRSRRCRGRVSCSRGISDRAIGGRGSPAPDGPPRPPGTYLHPRPVRRRSPCTNPSSYGYGQGYGEDCQQRRKQGIAMAAAHVHGADSTVIVGGGQQPTR
jgi:hypothetical protein